jgi:hypothetical protein
MKVFKAFARMGAPAAGARRELSFSSGKNTRHLIYWEYQEKHGA